MKHEIRRAYDAAAPTQAEAVRIYERILDCGQTEPGEAPRSRARTLRRLAVAAAAAAALVLTATAGYAAYRRWTLPPPETYEPGDSGIYQVHEQNDYASQNEDGTEPTESPDDGAPTDEALIRSGLNILKLVGLSDARPEKLTVVRQENLYWKREEAEVAFDRDGVRTTVKFNAETGQFLGMSGVDWQIEGSDACGGDAEAAALARRYYEALPVEQGYALTHVEKYDAQYWSYDFCREVAPGICNEYEMVRIAINPVSGRLTGCTVFFVPLLDDHAPGQERIGRQEAERIVQSSLPELLDGMTLTKAEVVIGLPNWNYTAYESSSNRRASNVTRWAWQLTYETETCDETGEYADTVLLLVDCYTGEILGGDATK